MTIPETKVKAYEGTFPLIFINVGESIMTTLFPTLWSLIRTWENNNNTALIYSDNDPEDPAEKLSYGELFEIVIKKAKGLKKESLPIEFPFAKTPECISTLFANLLIGNDLLLLEAEGYDNKSLPTGFEIKEVPPSNGPLSDDLFIKGVCEGRALFFTSGTTFSSKAVILTTRSLLRACYNGQSLSSCGEKDILLSVLPLAHVFGFICALLWGLCYGASVALSRGARNFFNDFSFFRPTIVSVVPAMAEVLVKAGSLNHDLRLMIIGAAAAREEVLEKLSQMNIEVHLGYGLTETASGIALHHDDKDPLALTPCPGCEFTIAEDGEILVKTESMMDGYLNGDTDSILKDGVLHTGDLGFIDEKGNLHVTGRKKDVIVLSSGTKVFLPEYEKALREALSVEDLAAVQSGRGKIVLFVGHPLPDGLSKDMLKKRVEEFNQTLQRDRQVSDIVFTPGPLPKTKTGKVMRYLLIAK